MNFIKCLKELNIKYRKQAEQRWNNFTEEQLIGLTKKLTIDGMTAEFLAKDLTGYELESFNNPETDLRNPINDNDKISVKSAHYYSAGNSPKYGTFIRGKNHVNESRENLEKRLCRVERTLIIYLQSEPNEMPSKYLAFGPINNKDIINKLEYRPLGGPTFNNKDTLYASLLCHRLESLPILDENQRTIF